MPKFEMYYKGVNGIVRFDKRPIFYDSNNLFDYSHGFDLLNMPSGRSSHIHRITSFAQTYEITLQIVGNNKKEVLDMLHDTFEKDINNYIKTGRLAKLYVGNSYLECLLSSNSYSKWNKMDMYENVTIQVLAPKPKWTIDEEFAYQKVDLTLNPYDLNLIKPPYDFSQLEFTQPAKPLSEANLIPNGWDAFESYGSGINYVENWDFNLNTNFWSKIGSGELSFEVIDGTLKIFNQKADWNRVAQTITLPDEEKEYLVRVKRNEKSNVDGIVRVMDGTDTIKTLVSDVTEFTIKESGKRMLGLYPQNEIGKIVEGGELWLDWIQVTPVDNQHLVVEKTPLKSGLTRIKTWGGSSLTKLRFGSSDRHTTRLTGSLHIKSLSNWFKITWFNQALGIFNINEPQDVYYTTTNDNPQTRTDISVNDINDNLDFIASDPVIVENDGSMIYDIQEYNDKYHIKTLNSHSKTKAQLPVKTSIFRNEQYTHSIEAENKAESDVIITSEKDTYLENPLVEVKPNEKGNFKYTGTVAKDKLYTNMEFATKEAEDELNLIVSKPAIRYGDKPFDWPPEEEIVPLRIPSQVPFWITADDSIKYISNNSIGDTLAKITMFGAIKNPTLYIGSNTYRVYEELLDNERIEIDQRNKTVVKITASGERVNVFHLRDKEHSVFKPIPEGENLVTQNDDFSYTVVLYHERNEPKWS